MMGMLLAGRWPGGDPPAWEAGEARPWPDAARRCRPSGRRPRASPSRGRRRGATSPPAPQARRGGLLAQAPPQGAARRAAEDSRRDRLGGPPRRPGQRADLDAGRGPIERAAGG